MNDLVAWLTQILDQQQRLYRDAPDFIEDPTSARSPGWGNLGDECEVCGAYQFSGLENVVEDAWYEHMEQVHQRTAVLADIAAKRAIIALHSTVITPSGAPWCDEDEHNWPCATLTLLASAYATRPGYLDQWRP